MAWSDREGAFEALEPRCLLSAPTAAYESSTFSRSEWLIVVRYTDDLAVDVSTIGNGDISVAGPGYAEVGQLSEMLPQTDGSAVAVYRVGARGGTWDAADNGLYTVSLAADAVRDTEGTPAVPGALSQLDLWFSPLAAEVVTTTVRGSDWLIVVRYAAPAAVDISTIGNDLVVRGPGYQETATLAEAPIVGDDGSVLATYRLGARGGTWDFSDNGEYTVSVAPDSVRDTNGVGITGMDLRRFDLWFSRPLAEIVSTTVRETDWLIVVRYTDDVGMDAGLIGDGDIDVVDGNTGAAETARLWQPVIANPDGSLTAVYVVSARGGAWDYLDNGQYGVRSRVGEVADAAGHFASEGIIGTFNLWFTTPTAELAAWWRSGPTDVYVVVRYLDDFGFQQGSDEGRVQTIGDTDVQMTAGIGAPIVGTARYVNILAAGWWEVMYRFTLSFENGGRFDLSVRAGEVSDAEGHFMPALHLGSIQVV